MSGKKKNQLSSFYSAYQLLINSAKSTINSVNEDPSILVEACRIIEEARNNQIHIVGMGRSGKAGMLIGEMLKNIGFNVTYLGKSLARPVREGDVVIGITGSGYTNFTVQALQDSIRNNAKIICFTGDSKSIAARLADSVIQIPTGYQRDKTTNHAPLTPMGTLFEMNSLAVGMGCVSGIQDGSIVKGFNEGSNEVLSAAEMTLDKIKANEEFLISFITDLEKYSCDSSKRVFVFGSGLDSIIASISSIRLSHLKINVKSTYDWRFRKEEDLLIAISGSGASTSTLERVASAKVVKMKTIGLTSFPKSKLALECDNFVEILGRTEETNAYLQQITELDYYVPSFEYVTAVVLDACVAQLAVDLKITESQMREEHANIE